MKRTIVLYLSILVTIVFFSSCEKDGDTVTMLGNPIAPSLNALPVLSV